MGHGIVRAVRSAKRECDKYQEHAHAHNVHSDYFPQEMGQRRHAPQPGAEKR